MPPLQFAPDITPAMRVRPPGQPRKDEEVGRRVQNLQELCRMSGEEGTEMARQTNLPGHFLTASRS